VTDNSYAAVMDRRPAIIQRATGLDYAQYARGAIAFDYERLFAHTAFDLAAVQAIQARTAVGNTPLVELHNITALARAVAPGGLGARILVKDEAANPSGSFKDRRSGHRSRSGRVRIDTEYTF
jgi:threonine synthase